MHVIYVYIHAPTCMHVHVCVCMFAYVYAYHVVYSCVYVCASLYTGLCMCVHMCVYCVSMCVCMHSCMHAGVVWDMYVHACMWRMHVYLDEYDACIVLHVYIHIHAFNHTLKTLYTISMCLHIDGNMYPHTCLGMYVWMYV